MSSVPLTHAQGLEPVRYALTFPAPHTHYVEVEASIPADGPTVELMMPVWTPGSYLVREYARHVEGVAARDEAGGPLVVEKSAKNRWRIESRGRPRITVTYRVYGREMSVRTNWIDAEFALINGAPTFLTVAGELTRPHEVTVTLPPAWKQAHTALPVLPGPAHRFRAPDYDTLVDSPMVLGNPAAYVSWLQLASHEFFHAWNVKRLRPVELGPFDYERENATRSLWVVEGITDYYGDLAVHRTGLADQKEYLDGLSDTVKTLQTTPGRQVQAVEMSSYDAWVYATTARMRTPRTWPSATTRRAMCSRGSWMRGSAS